MCSRRVERAEIGNRGPADWAPSQVWRSRSFPPEIDRGNTERHRIIGGPLDPLGHVLAEEAVDAKQQGSALGELPKPIRARLMAITREAQLLTAAIEQQLEPTAAKIQEEAAA